MPNFYVFNVTKQSQHGTDYPGVRIDTGASGAAHDAILAYVANPANGAAVGDLIRAVPGSQIVWENVIAQPNSSTAGAAPALPAVGS